MSTIRCIYTVEPDFPATDQHPSASRYQVGPLWVDAVGGAPTQGEVDAILKPPAAAAAPTLADLAAVIKQDAGLSAKLDKVLSDKARA